VAAAVARFDVALYYFLPFEVAVNAAIPMLWTPNAYLSGRQTSSEYFQLIASASSTWTACHPGA